MSIFVERGKVALRNVNEQIPDLNALTTLIRELSEDGDVSSCALTVAVLGDVINQNPLRAVQGVGAMSAYDKVDRIAQLLGYPNMVAVSISPDHHFVVVPVDTDKVVILQGFQGVYDLIQWRENRGSGIIRKDELLGELRALTTGDAEQQQAAAVALFSYDLATREEGVEQEIRDYYRDGGIIINSIAFKAL